MHEIFCHGRARIGRCVLQRRRITGSCRQHNGIGKRSIGFQRLYHTGHSGSLLADGHIDADHALALLVQYRIQGNGRLAGLPVSDNQLPLAPADGEHGINGQNAGFHRSCHRASVRNGRCLLLHGIKICRLDGALAVQGLSQGVDHSSEKSFAYGDTGPLLRADHPAALSDPAVSAKEHTADRVPPDILYHPLFAVVKLDDLAVHSVIQSVDGGNAVAHGPHGTHFVYRLVKISVLHRFPQNGNDPVKLPRVFRRPGHFLPEGSKLSLVAPVIFLSVHLQPETADEGRIFFGG